MSEKFTQSRFFLIAASLFLIVIVLFLGREIHRRYALQNEIDNLESEITALETKNDEVRELINYLKTPEYGERQARSLLDLQKPGEFVVALPERADSSDKGKKAESQDHASNMIKWWNYFFSEE